MRDILITSLLSFSLLLGSSSKAATEHQIDATLLQRIRQLLGIVQPIETAGTRGQPQKVCVNFTLCDLSRSGSYYSYR